MTPLTALFPRFVLLGTITVAAGAMLALLIGLVLRLTWLRHRNPLDQEAADVIRRHGYRFVIWFCSHNLIWIVFSALIPAILLLLFGTRIPVLIATSGSLACMFYGFLGLPHRLPGTIGLCWSHPIPLAFDNLIDQGETSLVLHRRYERVADQDLLGENPLLPVMTRILDRQDNARARVPDPESSRRLTFLDALLCRARFFSFFFPLAVFCALPLSLLLVGLGPPLPAWHLSGSPASFSAPTLGTTADLMDQSQTGNEATSPQGRRSGVQDKAGDDGPGESGHSGSGDTKQMGDQQPGSQNATTAQNTSEQNQRIPGESDGGAEPGSQANSNTSSENQTPGLPPDTAMPGEPDTKGNAASSSGTPGTEDNAASASGTPDAEANASSVSGTPESAQAQADPPSETPSEPTGTPGSGSGSGSDHKQPGQPWTPPPPGRANGMITLELPPVGMTGAGESRAPERDAIPGEAKAYTTRQRFDPKQDRKHEGPVKRTPIQRLPAWIRYMLSNEQERRGQTIE